jgi:RNA-directed DNA polymerase
MTSSAYKRLFSKAQLVAAWKKFLKDGKGQSASGVDGVTPLDFQRDFDARLNALRRQLASGQYSFAPLRAFSVAKTNGKGERLICVPTVQDRIVQRLLVDHLMSRPQASRILNDASFGFVKSSKERPRGVNAARDRAIELRGKHAWAYKSDISSFFDEIPRTELIERTLSIFRQPSLRDVVTSAVNCEVAVANDAIARMLKFRGIKHGIGVRQGMPISPLLSNIILEKFDRRMLERGYHLIRYADDFIVLADSYDSCLEIDDFARSLLSELPLKLPPLGDGSKTQIAPPDSGIEFLGLSLERAVSGSYQLVITESQVEKIKTKFSQLRDPEWLYKDRLPIYDIGKKISNMVGGYKAAYQGATNIDVLGSVFSVAIQDTVQRLYEQAFGKDSVQKLSPKFRAILGLDSFPVRGR